MTDEELKKLFTEAGDTPADPQAAARAKSAALAAFETVNEKKSDDTQASESSDRLIPEVTEIFRSRSMPSSNPTTSLIPRSFQQGLASAAVVVIAVSVLFNSNLNPVPDFSEIEATPGAKDSHTTQTGEQTLSEVAVTGNIVESEAAVIQAEEASMRNLARQQLQELRREAVAQRAAAPTVAADYAVAEMLTGSVVPQDMPVIPPVTGRDQFESLETNPVKRVSDEPVSTFSIDVDTASYSFVRRQLNQGLLPQKDAVRLEEMVNYFPYDYPAPANREVPFSTHVSVMDSPWKAGNKLLHIGIQGYDLDPNAAKPRTNLVFLLDVSGSMNSPDKLPLVKQSMGMLLESLSPDDTVAIVVYAGAAGAVLEPTPVKDKTRILAALQRLSAGGSTAGAAGIQLAYQLAEANFVEDGVNRIILATDGDFNVGITDRSELQGFVERKRDSGIFLSVLGFGQGNYHDQMMQTLAQNGNGIATYIDTVSEAQKVLVDEASSTLFPIAKDVKIQVEFNPATVAEYRLLGYESRMLDREDFNNDAVDAGEIGAGHSVTAIYELTPVGQNGLIDEPRYSGIQSLPSTGKGELAFVKVRYKLPTSDTSKLITQSVKTDTGFASSALAEEARFAVAVAGFAQLIKNAQYTADWTLDDALKLALENRGEDQFGYRAELTQLIRKAKVASAL